MITDSETSSILLREGYYSIINGYKEPFLDIDKTARASDDRYKEGTSFSDLYNLFLFDRDLRELTFHYLIKVEALVRTVCSYTFSEQHMGANDYLKQENFASEEEYLSYGLSGYVFNMQILHNELMKKATRSKRDFVSHYRDNHGWIPLWVLSNDLTFGNIEHFFNLMKPKEQELVCKRIVEATKAKGSKLGYFNSEEARVGLDVIVKVRNMCAHDERLYCAKIGKRKNCSYLGFMRYARRYLAWDEFIEFVSSVVKKVDEYSGESEVLSHVLRQMGFADLEESFFDR